MKKKFIVIVVGLVLEFSVMCVFVIVNLLDVCTMFLYAKAQQMLHWKMAQLSQLLLQTAGVIRMLWWKLRILWIIFCFVMYMLCDMCFLSYLHISGFHQARLDGANTSWLWSQFSSFIRWCNRKKTSHEHQGCWVQVQQLQLHWPIL